MQESSDFEISSSLGLKENLRQRLYVARQLFLTGRKLIEAEDERNHVDIFLPGEGTGSIGRHRDPDPIEQITDGQAIPVGHERPAGKPRRHVGALECPAVAIRTRLNEYGFTTPCLHLGVHAVPDRALGFLRERNRRDDEKRDNKFHSANRYAMY